MLLNLVYECCKHCLMAYSLYCMFFFIFAVIFSKENFTNNTSHRKVMQKNIVVTIVLAVQNNVVLRCNRMVNKQIVNNIHKKRLDS